MKKALMTAGVVAVGAAAMLIWLVFRPNGDGPQETADVMPSVSTGITDLVEGKTGLPETIGMKVPDVSADETEARVEAFDKLTDRWMQSREGVVSEKDVEVFVAAFQRIPKIRQNECLQRALNLIPDGNVMLLVGILMDKSVSRQVAETVFSDILNRSDEVKTPVMRAIYRDKAHPCWPDVAWIFDATGESKESGKSSP